MTSWVAKTLEKRKHEETDTAFLFIHDRLAQLVQICDLFTHESNFRHHAELVTRVARDCLHWADFTTSSPL